MAKRRVRTIAGLQRTLNAHNRRMAALYERPYIFENALATYAARFKQLAEIDDDAQRFAILRVLPALEADLDAIDRLLTPERRLSLAQQDRAKRPRVVLTESGVRIEDIVSTLLYEGGDPWQRKAKQYWGPLLNRLADLGLKPSVIQDVRRPAKERLEYQFGTKRRSLSEGQLANIISRLRSRRSRTLH